MKLTRSDNVLYFCVTVVGLAVLVCGIINFVQDKGMIDPPYIYIAALLNGIGGLIGALGFAYEARGKRLDKVVGEALTGLILGLVLSAIIIPALPLFALYLLTKIRFNIERL